MLKSCSPIIFCFPRGYCGLHFSRFSPWISTDPLNSVHIHGSTPFSPLDIHGPSFLSLRGYPRFPKNFRPPYRDNNSPYLLRYRKGANPAHHRYPRTSDIDGGMTFAPFRYLKRYEVCLVVIGRGKIFVTQRAWQKVIKGAGTLGPGFSRRETTVEITPLISDGEKIICQ